MAIAASSVTPTNSLEDFRIEFNNLVSDVSGITATNKFTENIIFEGATADAYETTLTVSLLSKSFGIIQKTDQVMIIKKIIGSISFSI